MTISSKRDALGFWIVLLGGVILLVLVAGYAFWFTSDGQFPVMPALINLHVDLGEAFLHGQVALPQQPDSRLAALENPYDMKHMESIPFLWDVSYYNGKYYLYWGPVPALMFAAWEGLSGARPPGQLVFLICFTGLLVVLLSILILLWRRYYPNAPGWSIGLFLPVMLVNLPFGFLLARPTVYETSIMAGQFFLFLGLLAWIGYLGSEKLPWLAAAGLCWGLALGARLNLALSVGIFLLFALQHFIRRGLRFKNIVLLGSPVILVLLALAVYNAARFGSPLETGVRFMFGLLPSSKGYFSPVYFLTNLVVYLVAPLRLSTSFPFVQFPFNDYAWLPEWRGMLGGNSFEPIFGGFLTAVPLAVVPFVLAPVLAFARRKPGAAARVGPLQTRQDLCGMIGLAALVQFLLLMVFFHAVVRYMVDFTAPVLLVGVLLVWELDERWRQRLVARELVWGAVVISGLWGIGIGFFSPFAVPPGWLSQGHPALYHSLAVGWDHLAHALAGLFHSLGTG